MNRVQCEREDRTSTAVLSGPIAPEIAAHPQHCPVCAEIVLVSGFLRNNSTLANHEATAVPDAGFIWRKAERRATQRDARLAVRPIRWMTALACVAFACSPWLRVLLPLGRDVASSWSRAFDSNLTAVSRIWLATPNEPMIIVGVSGTMILLGLSSWLMLREE